jgi:hypothetical protein
MTKSTVYTGKLFKLKKMHKIYWATKPNKKPYGTDPDYKDGVCFKDKAPEQVMILDERAKKIKVYLGKEIEYVWISKFYIGDEIITSGNRESCELLDKSIKQLSNILSKNVQRPNEEKAILCEILKNVRLVRTNLE